MYSEETVRNSVRYLYQGAVHECGCSEDTVEDLLKKLDYHALASVFQKNARRVYAYDTREGQSVSVEYRGQDLFGQRAVPLYETMLCCGAGIVTASHTYEVWLKEDGNLVTVSCVAVNYERGEYETAFREIRGYPFGCDLELNLERLTRELRELYGG